MSFCQCVDHWYSPPNHTYTAPWWHVTFDDEPTFLAAKVVAEVSDKDACYSFDELTVLKSGDLFYVAQTSGCSCPSLEENAKCTFGPVSTLQEVIEWVKAGHYTGMTFTNELEKGLIQQLEEWKDVE